VDLVRVFLGRESDVVLVESVDVLLAVELDALELAVDERAGRSRRSDSFGDSRRKLRTFRS